MNPWALAAWGTVSIGDLTFHQPWLLVGAGAALLLLLAGQAAERARRRRVLGRIGDPLQLQRMAASLSPRRRRLKENLFIAAVVLGILALARPTMPGEAVWRQRGIDLVVVMDYSKSMLAADVRPSRVKRMEQEVDQLLDELESDRIAIVAFAGGAIHFPLTQDAEAARSLYRGLSPLDLPPGSNLAEGLLSARCILRPDLGDDPGCRRIGGHGSGGAPLPGDSESDQPAETSRTVEERGRVVVLFTDGGGDSGSAGASALGAGGSRSGSDGVGDPAQQVADEVRRANELGIDLFLVGIGTAGGAKIPEIDDQGGFAGWKRDREGREVVSRLDGAALESLARLGAGQRWRDHLFLLDPDRVGAPALLEQLREVKRGDLEKRVVRQPRDIYQWFLFPAFLLLVLEVCLSDRRRRPAPGAPPRRV
jgi:Ca-activated chloride channel homolog